MFSCLLSDLPYPREPQFFPPGSHFSPHCILAAWSVLPEAGCSLAGLSRAGGSFRWHFYLYTPVSCLSFQKQWNIVDLYCLWFPNHFLYLNNGSLSCIWINCCSHLCEYISFVPVEFGLIFPHYLSNLPQFFWFLFYHLVFLQTVCLSLILSVNARNTLLS